SYYNFSGTHVSGQLTNPPSPTNLFLRIVWDSYATAKGVTPNYGSKDPVSYYSNTGNLSLPLAYVDPNTYSVVVNPNRWTAEGQPANGVMIGQITLATDA